MYTTANGVPSSSAHHIYTPPDERVSRLCPHPLGPSWSTPVYWLFHRYPIQPSVIDLKDHLQDDEGVPLSATHGAHHFNTVVYNSSTEVVGGMMYRKHPLMQQVNCSFSSKQISQICLELRGQDPRIK